MFYKIRKSDISGTITIPGSKSHTIRAIFIASLSNGMSFIRKPLLSDDSKSAIKACESFGAKIEINNDYLKVYGFGKNPKTPTDIIDIDNSGTTLRIAMSTAALLDGTCTLTGDEQIRSRPLLPLIEVLNELGAEVTTLNGNGKAPVIIKGKMHAGEAVLDAVTSQYLSSLLLHLPLLDGDSVIYLSRLNEIPYIDITLWWLDKQGIKYENDDYKKFKIFGRQEYHPMDIQIPGDFSSATFFAVNAAISGKKIVLKNLDFTDPQGDKRVFEILSDMGAKINIKEENNEVEVCGDSLKGISIDMNSIPDALPSMAVLGCFAKGETKLYNVRQARIKETDRIQVMCKELTKLGADIKELEDGLIIKESKLKGAAVCGYADHRVVMALSIAGLNIEGETVIDTAESVAVTFPGFREKMVQCGASIIEI